jgi:hypothetical protein
MKTKICCKCRKEKSEEDFSYRNKCDGRRQSVCKLCHSEYAKYWYKENTERHRENTRKWNAKHFQVAKEFVSQYLLRHPCVDCGNSDIRVLDFDHVHGNKKNEIANMVKNGSAIKSISKEIDKCEVRCANCHRIRHWIERNAPVPI